MPAAILKRTTLRTSRLLDFASEKELVAQTGHPLSAWPLVILKELIDNGIDACEEAGIAPVISVTVDDAGITVEDNGPGIPGTTIEGVLDFTVRVSSREAYVSPTRGAQGNALKTIVAMPFVVSSEKGDIEIEAGSARHLISMKVDRIRQEPVVKHVTETIPARKGTLVRIIWPNLPRSIGDDQDRFVQMADDFAWLNPHLTLKFATPDTDFVKEATNPAWTKWLPSDPTSPHWYDVDRLGRLLAGYISDGRQCTIRDFVSEFRGLARSGSQKKVLDATGLAREPLTHLVAGDDLNRELIAKLLAAMKAESKPVKPDMLGVIGRDHFRQRFEAIGAEMESFDYRCVKDTEDGIPCVYETAFCWCPDTMRRLVTGVNWSPGIVNPFRELGKQGVSLDTILTQQRTAANEPVILVLHVACARVSYTDRGKSSVVTS
jgi:DNA topoisomerase VI subunit B